MLFLIVLESWVAEIDEEGQEEADPWTENLM